MAFELGKTASGAKYIIGLNGNHIYLSQAGVKIKNEQSGGVMKDFLYVMNLGELIYSGPLDSVIYMGSPISSNPIDAINFLVAEGWVNFNSGSGGGTIDPQDYDLADFKNQSSDPFVQESDLTLKADLVSGKVPASQLPSYVDDVLEFADLASFPVTGETGKLYVALDTNKLYRWSGSAYVDITQYANLQSVTDVGNETTNSIVSSSDIKGLSLTVQSAIDTLFKGSFVANNVFGNYEYEVPDRSGTLALKEDVQALNLQAITDVGNETTNSIVLNGGDLEITDPDKNIIIKSPNGSRWKIEIDNSGVISTTLIP